MKLLPEGKDLNIPQWNLLSKEDVQKATKGTIIKYKEIIIGVNCPICIRCMDELKKQQVIDDKTSPKA